ncbi:hypothetical protein VD0002_g7575 [Verticillium dahliae]|uniref:Uncharacterized protein n=2 Tax=Verticillium dahliae TaxID=27337 RepID=G2XDA4_VERDV|nr:uncharacterized protein VDAG_08136 [Verticillium dahliae VdLs.17]KAF3347818.1 40S ribosomal protein S0 [Verticillium dahliae VDG2]KAH6696153.1 hypothetical protein EV126DRAFT_508951 [Verticillium dahliae]EGY16972.1 hypothetical protein VDAG_08136 [Verticillium dahliae VdLs.17]PNH31113.1 hypothetical protein BJF96_g5472 [Verticillium dahliae]PNH53747.1 hypothetical protein VD0003_g3719 [Verticillium dahliae]
MNRFVPRVSRVLVPQARLSSSSSAPRSSTSPASADAEPPNAEPSSTHASSTHASSTPAPKAQRKTMAELDAELRLKMEGISGEGGAAGVEYEDGKAEGLKRGVKSNMFRVI